MYYSGGATKQSWPAIAILCCAECWLLQHIINLTDQLLLTESQTALLFSAWLPRPLGEGLPAGENAPQAARGGTSCWWKQTRERRLLGF